MSPHGWSQWVPSADGDYRYRYNDKGNPVYDYRDPRSAEEAMAGLSLNDAQEQVYSPETSNYQYARTASIQPGGGAYPGPGMTQYGDPGQQQYIEPQYGGSRQYTGDNQYTPDQTQPAGSQYAAGPPYVYSDPQYEHGTQPYGTEVQYGANSETQPQPYSATQYPSSSSHDPTNPSYTSTPPAEPRPSRHARAHGGGSRSDRPRRAAEERNVSHKKRGKGTNSQQPNDPFYADYYPSEQTPSDAYYPSPAPESYTTSADVEDEPGNTNASTHPDTITPTSRPVPQAQAPLEGSGSYADGTYSQANTANDPVYRDPGYEDENFGDEMDQAKFASRQPTIYNDPFEGSSTAGPSSYAAADQAYVGGNDYSVDPGAYDKPDVGSITPRALTPRPGSPSEVIRAGVGERQKLDPRYQVHYSSAFDVGRVFKVVSADPKGNTAEDATDTMKLQNSFGEDFYVGIRRFIIIASDEGNSTCVPILTYRGLGCLKKGVKPRTHGIIYGSNDKNSKRAKPLQDEPKMGFHPICMRVTAQGEKLARESRVNYAKLVTIEHNVKVFFIGCLEGENFEVAKDAVDKCWSHKTREPKRRRH